MVTLEQHKMKVLCTVLTFNKLVPGKNPLYSSFESIFVCSTTFPFPVGVGVHFGLFAQPPFNSSALCRPLPRPLSALLAGRHFRAVPRRGRAAPSATAPGDPAAGAPQPDGAVQPAATQPHAAAGVAVGGGHGRVLVLPRRRPRAPPPQ